MRNDVFLLLGSNLNDPVSQLETARKEILHEVGPIMRTSSLYKTAPWGVTKQPAFYNQVVAIETMLSPEMLLRATQDIEKKMGRERKEKWGARVIDIDILFYGDAVIQSDTLTIPHPRLTERRFTLVPLDEIAPDFLHPVLQKKVRSLLEACPDTLAVERILL